MRGLVLRVCLTLSVVLVVASLLLVYVAFIRRPAHALTAFVEAGCRPSAGTLVVAAGSSTTHGTLSADYVGDLRARLGGQGYTFVNAGLNGSTSSTLRARVGEIVACQPHAVTIFIGANDAREADDAATTPDAFRANLTATVQQIQAATTARIALLSMQPLGEDPASDANVMARRYNTVMQQVAAEHNITYLPVYETLSALIAEHDGVPPPTAQPGPRLLAEAAIRRYLLRQSWDTISAAQGLVLLTDQIHLNDRAGALVADLIEEWLVQ